MQKVVQLMKRMARAVQLAPKAIRVGGGIAPTLAKALELYQREGWSGIRRGFRAVAHSGQMGAQFATGDKLGGATSKQAAEVLAPRVVIIAELSIPQCTKYRVMQKRDMLERLGYECTVVSWTDAAACFTAIATHSLAIFYRVPAFAHIENLIAEARRLRVPTFWEVDDLIFDRDLLAMNSSLQRLDAATRNGALRGAVMYRGAMLRCDFGIASTSGLRDAMRAAGVPKVFVVENALDTSTLEGAALANARARQNPDGVVRIVYGSGTNTHNEDFREAADAILRTLHRYPHVRFRLIGLLDLPPEFNAVQDRIERIEFCQYNEYLQHLAECDINVAPLEPGEFNDAKSNIKYLEASAVRLPSVCSPRKAFTTAITHGVDGLLCDSVEEWERSLSALVEDAPMRKEIGARAYASVMERYSPENIAERQVRPVVALLEEAAGPKRAAAKPTLRVLSVNVLYKPRSFGGATIVAEQVNHLLAARDDMSVYVFTTLGEDLVPASVVRRYEAGAQTVFGTGVPFLGDPALSFDNPRVTAAFTEVLNAVRPDLVHFHSIQHIGVGALDACRARGIPHIVTAHDAWWVCGRQFMVTRQGSYCRQEAVDLDVCSQCVDDANLNRFRQHRLSNALKLADRILVPSHYFAEFYRANGFDEERITVNRNGILRPATKARLRKPGPLRFGYVGGNIALKGVDLVREAFRRISDLPVRLIVVDNALNLGASSFPGDFFKGVRDVEIVPAYTQQNIDDFFDSVDVLLFPTQAKESFGLTVREALARGVWVITTDAGGVVEDIFPGRNGLIIPFNSDAKILEAAIRRVVEIYDAMPAGSVIDLPSPSLTYFDAQAEELAQIYHAVAADRRRAHDIGRDPYVPDRRQLHSIKIKPVQ